MSNDWVYMSILLDCKSVPLLQFFLWLKSAIWWTSINPNLVYALANRRFFPDSRALGGKCWRLSRFSFMSRLQGVRICGVFVGGNSN